MFRLLVAALVVCSQAAVVFADEPPVLEFVVEFDEDGNATLVDPPLSEQNGMMLAPTDMHDGSDGNNIVAWGEGIGDFDGYKVIGPEGDQAKIMVPKGNFPAVWLSDRNTFGLEKLPESELFKATFLGSTREKARSLLREISEAAYSEYCGNDVRPSEFSIEVSMGADLVVSGSATFSAKFITADMCGN